MLQDQIKDKSEQLQFKELRREAAKNVHNYKECDKLTEQISVVKADRRRLQLKLTTLTRKQQKAEWYLAKKCTALKTTVPQPISPPFRLMSSSPEPRSPSSTPISQSSFSSSPSPRLPPTTTPISCHTPSPDLPPLTHSMPYSDGGSTSAVAASESGDTFILSSDESSCAVDS